jgi:uncharacterized protein YoxC
VTAESDIASVAEHLAELTRTVEALSRRLKEVSDQAASDRARADTQQANTATQQGRLDLAARELADVSESLQAAATTLRELI